MDQVEITYFSDVLCIWAYVSEARMTAVKEKFGDKVRIRHRFCSVFGDTAGKIKLNWKDKGGYQGFNAHLLHTAEKFPHITLHPDIWLKTRPPSSASPHLFMKAVQEWERDTTATGQAPPGIFDQLMWALRNAFFHDCRDISRWEVQCEIAESVGANIGAIKELIHSGAAFAGLAADYQDADKMRIEGSPESGAQRGASEDLRKCRLSPDRSEYSRAFPRAARGGCQLVLMAIAHSSQSRNLLIYIKASFRFFAFTLD